ncbi:hypothetical protein NEUTE1DRAFT_92489 [Neurospora tetrasperma FGSC 2508]|uniref:Rhodopsin domain-containing protein n=1 Tax=Neurospora tetrasperma (strain FGSC 2508 / ATCC MYA-4615 / P0657) TaxID=510951 RepID=F8N2Q1_NEUT8|nr:uncharacterized protein NEUTE1DRAFT_92489 [Neurospora tetrasperma FGSC 2508]EGO53315.1 hypothetical protein NEUTE1DRAFT_92489 [Neurospora tetrasperma FGSC 2508]EGZ76353.1 hypothetical protein NEUTE2DRAFT_98086 [Neurospora tetrasperma FGSC 2509]
MIRVPGNKPGDNRAHSIETPAIVLFFVTLFLIGIRLWARFKPASWKGLGWDDYTILLSWVFATVVSALMIASCAYGFGQHIRNLSRENKLMTLKLFYVAQAFYKITINLTKTSILLLYLRIFVQRWFRIACYILIGIIIAYMIATFGASVWQCTPVARAWDKSIPGTCVDITVNWYANAGFSISTDILILALPMYPIFTSHLRKTQKVAVVLMFALGFFTTITSILRMQTLTFSTKTPDTTYDLDSSIWTIIEQNMAIICACLPVCRLPLAYLFPKYFAISRREQQRTGPEGDIGHREISSQSELRSWQGPHQHDVAIEAGVGVGGIGLSRSPRHQHQGGGMFVEMDRKYSSTTGSSGRRHRHRRPSASGSVSSDDDDDDDDVERKISSTTDVGRVTTVYQRDRVSTEDDDKMVMVTTTGDATSEDTILHVSSVSAATTMSRSNSRLGIGLRDRDRSADRMNQVGGEGRPGGGIQMTTQFSVTYDQR